MNYYIFIMSMPIKGGNDFMQQVNVKFNNVNQIRQFVDIIDKFDSTFDLGEGRRTVDAKSILGVMALDFTRPLKLRFYICLLTKLARASQPCH